MHTPEGWNTKTFAARVRSSRKRQLHPAGSPNAQEILTYRYAVLQGNLPPHKPRHALILGMTSALRRLLQRLDWSWTCVDNNPQAIAFYRDWLDASCGGQERIIEADWLQITSCIDKPVDVIFGDGVFGNLITLAAHEQLLDACKQVLAPRGVMVFRKILKPYNPDRELSAAQDLLARFRRGELTEAEFGFGMRIEGGCEWGYDPDTCLLDNRVVFTRLHEWQAAGRLSSHELAIIERYYFGGLNLVPSCEQWERLLQHCGLDFRRHPLRGKTWYAYYPLYRCSLA